MPIKGYKITEAHRKALSDSHKGIIPSLESRKKRSLSMMGKKHSLETIKKMSEAQKGIKRPYAKPPHFFGEKSSHWKGDNVGYFGLHSWLKRTFGKAFKCQNIKCVYPRRTKNGSILDRPKRYEWANISYKYKREQSDWIQLCASCHRKMDLKIIKIDTCNKSTT